jgi:hypothetical protein
MSEKKVPKFADVALQMREALLLCPDFRYVNPRSYEVWWKGPRAEALENYQAMLDDVADEFEREARAASPHGKGSDAR